MRADKKDNIILKLTYEFSIEIIRYTDYLEDNRKYCLARQLFRSGTAIGALAREAQNAESKIDFIHKFKIAAKEMDESEYWLDLCKVIYNHSAADELLVKLEEISKIINKIIATSKK